MTKFELRYGGVTIETETEEEMSLEKFVEMLGCSGWWVIDDEGVAIQVSQIDRVKVLK